MSDPALHYLSNAGRGFLERTLAELVDILERSFVADAAAASHGLLQNIDARVKLFGAGVAIVAAASSHNLGVLSALLGIALALAAASRIPFKPLGRVWLSAFLFTGTIALPAVFLTPGKVVAHIPPFGWGLTQEGVGSAVFLFARAVVTGSYCSILVFTTPWNYLLKALRAFLVPTVVVVLIGMTYRYIFLLATTAIDMVNSKRSRMVGPLPVAERRRLAMASAGVLMSKSFELSNEVHLAMQARGYRGEVYVLEEFSMRWHDWLSLGVLALAAASMMVGSR